jgi:hypothetical protein
MRPTAAALLAWTVACSGRTGAPNGGSGSTPDGGGADGGAVTAPCAPLPPPRGAVVPVTPAQADDLPSIVGSAPTGTTILLEDGVYRSSRSGEAARRINLRTPGVALRSASGAAAAVVLCTP